MEKLFLFAGLESAKIEQLLLQLDAPVAFEKGDVIYGEAHTAALGVLLEGKGECVSSSGGLLMKVFHKGEVFGAASIFDDAPVSWITALGTCCVQYIPQVTLLRWMEQEPIVATNYIRFLSEKVRFLNRKIALLTMDSVQSRVMEYLLSQANAQNVVQIKNMSQLAKTLGVGRTSLYRALDDLSKCGWITRNEKQIM